MLDCKHRAIEAHKAEMTANEILKIREIILENPDYFVGVAENIAQTVNKATLQRKYPRATSLGMLF